jgi:hypothetical protein
MTEDFSVNEREEPAPKLEWFGNAGHFICGHLCRFHLTTIVNDLWLVSTVGEMWPERSSREIRAKVEDPAWLAKNMAKRGDDFDFAYMKKFGYDTIGCDRTYETMVFRAGKRCERKECGCGLPELASSELDFGSYNDVKAATEGHHALVAKWSALTEEPAHD